VLQLLRRLDRRRFEPWLAVFEAQPDGARLLLDDFRAAGVQVVPLARRGRYSPRALWRYGALLRGGRFGVVHTHALRADLATLLWLGSVRPRPRLVRSIHNTDRLFEHPLLGRLAAFSLQRFDRVIVISDAVGGYVRRTTGLAEARMRRIRYGLAPSAEPAPVVAPRGADERRVILVPARLDPQKGQDVILEALPAVRAAVPNAEVWLAGHETGTSSDELRALAERLGVSDAVRFLGFREDMAALMRRAEIVALPSRWEGFGLVLLEAMDACRPLVASAVGAIPEVVEDGVTGLLVPPEQPAALAQALLALLRDPQRAARLGAAGRRRLEQQFDERAMIEATEGVYNGLLGGGPAARVALTDSAPGMAGPRDR